MSKEIKKIVFEIFSIFTFTSCISFNFNKTESLTDEKIYNTTGNLIIKNEGITELVPCTNNNYAIKVNLKTQTKQEEAYLIIDTGSFPNLLSSEILSIFDDKVDSGHYYMADYTYIGQTSSSRAYYFDSMETDGFIATNILFLEFTLKNFNFGETINGKKIMGLIGMETLRKLPFKFSFSSKELQFFETSEGFPKNGNKIEFTKEKLPHTLETEYSLNELTHIKAYLDTGAYSSLIPENKYNKTKNNEIKKKYEQKYKNHTISHLIFNELDFFNTKILNPFFSTRTKMTNSTLGNNILSRFDIYIDTQKGEGVFIENGNNFQFFSLNEYSKITNGRPKDYEFAGIEIDSYRVLPLGIIATSNIGEHYIVCTHYVDGKAICPDLKPNDQILSVNGIPQKEFDWKSFSQLKEIDLTVKRGRKIISTHITRHNYIGDEVY